jgi:hypothetical protein
MFVTPIHFHPSTIFAGEAGAYLNEQPEEVTSLAYNHYFRMEVTKIHMHSSLLWYGINCSHNMFYDSGLRFGPLLT